MGDEGIRMGLGVSASLRGLRGGKLPGTGVKLLSKPSPETGFGDDGREEMAEGCK